MKGFIYVKNTAVGEIALFSEEEFDSLEDAKKERDRIRDQYSQVGCHDVKLLVELYPEGEE